MGSILEQLGKGLEVWGVPPPAGFYTVHRDVSPAPSLAFRDNTSCSKMKGGLKKYIIGGIGIPLASQILPCVCIVFAKLFWVSLFLLQKSFLSLHDSPWRRQTQRLTQFPKVCCLKGFQFFPEARDPAT